MESDTAYVIANFGGPREKEEVFPFLQELLCDTDVIQTRLPSWFQRFLFTKIAKRRSKKVAKDYEEIGGKSPIFADTEHLVYLINRHLNKDVLSFHRYLPSTHKAFFKKLEEIKAKEIRIFPCFPQFCYATTGSIARLFSTKLSPATLKKIRWIKSFAGHPAFINTHTHIIEEFLKNNNLSFSSTFLLFSAHGIPEQFVQKGDLYQSECEISYRKIIKGLPSSHSLLCYQSKFGPGKWLKPYTSDVCRTIQEYAKEKKHVVFIPLSFISDHIETLFEVEKLYLPLVEKRGYKAHRCPALNLHPKWIEAVMEILDETNLSNNQMLVRR